MDEKQMSSKRNSDTEQSQAAQVSLSFVTPHWIAMSQKTSLSKEPQSVS